MSKYTPYSYQTEGAEFLVSKKRALLADEPGTGKTLQAIRAMDIAGIERGYVFCPLIAMSHWQREIEEQQNLPRKVMICQRFPKNKAELETWKDAHVKIIPYSSLSTAEPNQLKLLHDDPLADFLILDECHMAKNYSSKRTRAIYAEQKNTKNQLLLTPYVWLLSGTPAPNHAGELFSHLRTWWPDLIRTASGKAMTESEFIENFCHYRETPYGRSIYGTKNRDALKAILGTFTLRRKQVDVLKDLPELRVVTTLMDKSCLKTQNYDLTNVFIQMSATLKNIVGRNPGEATPDEIIMALRKVSTSLSSERATLGRLKVPAVLEWVQNELDGNHRKIILFCEHHGVIDDLVTGLASFCPVQVDGRIKQTDRDEAIRLFNEDPECRTFIGQTKACGTSITLTAASVVGVVEPPWSPNDLYQCVKRAHRIGQTQAVIGHVLTLPDTLDEVTNRVLARKAREIAELFD